ncbi:MAG: tRNA (guanosine(37)-N1)-methyltransferase TrmD [Gammaproteobacteria bacterium]|nr:tRNA (guanosine(37)-N1)-methyltransferase TrmD [Gammaproteobacteria bacterium]
MWVGVVTIFPEMFQAVSQHGITRRAIEAGLLTLDCFNPRDFAADRHRTVDDRPYGGGPGMLMKVEPLRDAIASARRQAERVTQGAETRVLYLSPQGQKVDQATIEKLQARDSMILVAGRYEGIDERVIDKEIDEEYSIGDYVLSGGELPAMVLIDAMTRLIPGALGHSESAASDSFSHGLLDYPQYTRPEVIEDLPVPEILLSGNHAAIAEWRLKQSLGRTQLKRPDLLEHIELNENQRRLLEEYLREIQEISGTIEDEG